jgi:AcrR family transcriptional regulator
LAIEIIREPRDVKATTDRKTVERQPYHHGDLRTALITAALALIDQHGVKGFTLKDAARMAGVSIAAPYRHFADKEALLEAIQREGFAAFNAALAESRSRAATAKERLIELGVAYLHFAIEHPAHIRVMFGMSGGAKEEHPQRAPDGMTGYALLVESVAALDPQAPASVQRDMTLACWSIVHGYAMLFMEGAFAATAGFSDPEAQLRRTLARLVDD